MPRKPQKRFCRNQSKKEQTIMKRQKKGLIQDKEEDYMFPRELFPPLPIEKSRPSSSSNRTNQLEEYREKHSHSQTAPQTFTCTPLSPVQVQNNSQYEVNRSTQVSNETNIQHILRDTAQHPLDLYEVKNPRGLSEDLFPKQFPYYQRDNPLLGFQVTPYEQRLRFKAEQDDDQFTLKPKHKGFLKENPLSDVSQETTPLNIILSRTKPAIPPYQHSIYQNQQENLADSEQESANEPYNVQTELNIQRTLSFAPTNPEISTVINSVVNITDEITQNYGKTIQGNPEQLKNTTFTQNLAQKFPTSSLFNKASINSLDYSSSLIKNMQFIYPEGMFCERQLRDKIKTLKQLLNRLPPVHEFFIFNSLMIKDATKSRHFLLTSLKKIKCISAATDLLKERQVILEEKQKILPMQILEKTNALKRSFIRCTQLKNTLFECEKINKIIENQQILFKSVIFSQPGKPQCLYLNPDQGIILLLKWIRQRLFELKPSIEQLSIFNSTGDESMYEDILKSQVEYIYQNSVRLQTLKLKIKALKSILSQSRPSVLHSLFKEKISNEMSRSDWYYYNLLKQSGSISESKQRRSLMEF